MSDEYRLIRGPRILAQLDERSYSELERNTNNFVPPSSKRQHAVAPIQVQQLKLVAAEPSHTLEATGTIKSGANTYQSIIFFDGVRYAPEDTGNNVTFMGADSQEHHMEPIKLNIANAKVRCTCLDFRWRFSMHNQQKDALYGPGPGAYQKKTNRPPNNPQQVPGLCKHLLKLAQELRNSKIVI